MTVQANRLYGAYTQPVPAYLSSMGVVDSEGVIPDPQEDGFLLCEDGSFLTQENGGKLLLE